MTATGGSGKSICWRAIMPLRNDVKKLGQHDIWRVEKLPFADPYRAHGTFTT